MKSNVQLVGFLTLATKEVTRVLRIWKQTLLPPVITTSLYFLIFGSFIGERIGKLHDFTYIQFIVPGLIMLTVLTNAYSNVSSSVFGAKFQNNIEELLVSPLKSTTILLGFISGGIVRSLIVGLLVSLISMFFSPFSITHLWIMISTLVLTSILFSLFGFLNALYANSFDDISIIPIFVLTPLTYLGGVFYSIKLLSPFWQKVSLFNPVLYLVNLFRYGVLGYSDINIQMAWGFLLVITLILWIICYTFIKKGIGLRN